MARIRSKEFRREVVPDGLLPARIPLEKLGIPVIEKSLVILIDRPERRSQHKAVERIGIHQRRRLGDQAAEREAHKMAPLDLQVVKQVHQVFDKSTDLVAPLDPRRLAETAQIVAQDPVTGAKMLENGLPGVEIRADSVDERHHWPLPFDSVPRVDRPVSEKCIGHWRGFPSDFASCIQEYSIPSGLFKQSQANFTDCLVGLYQLVCFFSLTALMKATYRRTKTQGSANEQEVRP